MANTLPRSTAAVDRRRRSRTWRRRRAGSSGTRVQRVHEVDPRAGRRARRTAGRRAADVEHVPLHLRALHAGGQPAHRARGATPSPATPGASSRAVEEHLHADADAEERPAGVDGVDGDAVEAGVAAAPPCTRPKAPDAGQHDRRRRRAIRPGSAVRRASAPTCCERLLRPSAGCRCRSRGRRSSGRRASSRHSTPLVDGTPRALDPHGVAQATGPAPLNVASMMWCTLRPRRSVTCSVMPAAVANACQTSSASCGSNGGSPSGMASGSVDLADDERPAGQVEGHLDQRLVERAAGRWRSGARRPCRRAPRGTPRRARCRRPRPCGGCRRGGRPWPAPSGRSRRGGRAGRACGRRTGGRC